MKARETGALGAAALVVVVTFVWWALAFWPAPSDTLWLARVRNVCFGILDDGLPDARGWISLFLEPPAMFGLLFVVAGAPLKDGIRTLWRLGVGRVALAAGVVGIMAGAHLMGVRIQEIKAEARLIQSAGSVDEGAGEVRRLDLPVPDAPLIDHHGDAVDLARFRGRPVLVTFAFGHCETVCPIVVRDARAARANVQTDAVLLVMTLDPWRDTPTRLPTLAQRWELEDNEYALGGPVQDVEAALDAWDVFRKRDLRTGDVFHQRLVYIVNREGRITFATDGGWRTIADLLEQV